MGFWVPRQPSTLPVGGAPGNRCFYPETQPPEQVSWISQVFFAFQNSSYAGEIWFRNPADKRPGKQARVSR